MSKLNLFVPEELKSYIKAKALEMNTSVSEIFVDYVKQIKNKGGSEVDKTQLSNRQSAKLALTAQLSGSIILSEDIDLDDLRFKHLIEKHLKDE